MNKLTDSVKINVIWKDRFEKLAKENFPRVHQKVIDFVYDAMLIQETAGIYGFKNCKTVPCVEISSHKLLKIFRSCKTSTKVVKFLTDNNFIEKDNSWVSVDYSNQIKKPTHANRWHIKGADFNPFDKLITLKLARRPIVEDAINSLSKTCSYDGVDHGMVYGDKVIDLYEKGEFTVVDLLQASFFANMFFSNLEEGQDSYKKDFREYSAVAMCPKKIRSVLFGLEETYDIPAASLPTTLLNHQLETGDTSNKELVKKVLKREIDPYKETYDNTINWKNYYKNWEENTRKRIKGSFSVVVHCNEKQLEEFTTLTYINHKTATKEEKFVHNNRWTNFEVVDSINRTFPQFAKILAEICTQEDAGRRMFLYHTKGEKYFMDKVFETLKNKGVDTSYKALNVVRVHDAIWCKPEYKETVKQALLETIESL